MVYSDEDLVRQIQDGDAAAFDRRRKIASDWKALEEASFESH
jgi:hypothetical protein